MDNITLGSSRITLAKIVPTPTVTGWSQAYNAGSLFAVFSLGKDSFDEEKESLNILGKEILDRLEKEYYSTEEKNLETVKEVVSLAISNLPDDVKLSFAVASVIPASSVLYLFCRGEGKAVLKRGKKLGVILNSKEEISSSSGYLKEDDLVILETKEFSDIVSYGSLSSLDCLTPGEISEELSPKIHEKESKGESSAIIFSIKKIPSSDIEDEIQKEKGVFLKININPKLTMQNLYLKIRSKTSNIPHEKKIFLTIFAVFLCVFVLSLFFAVKKRTEDKNLSIFQNSYPTALKKYEEGKNLLDLNKTLAGQSFNQAKDLLEDAVIELKKDSKEEKQTRELLEQINESISSSSNSYLTDAKEVDGKNSPILNFEKSNPQTSYYTQDDKNIYFVNDKGAYLISKDQIKDAKQIAENNKWSIGGIGVFNENVYILDKKVFQIYKFSKGSYSQSDYLSKPANFSKGKAIAIDSAIYVLSGDGTLNKFLKGKPENFQIKGLDNPLSNPERIFTDSDANNIYVLDNGNSRIVVLDKKGTYQSQYQNKILKDARDFEVLESSKKIYILSRNKIWEMELK